ncbi:hypothetical protein [Niastella sp. OAS944]|uniref:hypothetical protein n=1 Tax=Niastella sp. OAS944 TaxID=2664089 RepID=UPI003470A40B|nr:hypothetical protein [Chitinophagaceae bacterium OAS944]
MTNTTTLSFGIQATSLFKYERTTRQTNNGKRYDTTVTTLTLTGGGKVNVTDTRRVNGLANWR